MGSSQHINNLLYLEKASKPRDTLSDGMRLLPVNA